jgi:hypothetical protein
VTVEWSSSAASIAGVGNGNVFGVSPGSATITARVGTVAATVAVTVLPAVLGSNWDESTLRLAGGADAPSGFVAAAWAFGPSDIMVAASPSFHRWDGTSWRVVPGSPFGVEAMWGSGATQLFGVGQRILRFDGTAWTEMTNPGGNRLRAVWGSGPSSVYAVGQGGTILRFNGTAWSAMSSPTTANLVGVAGVGDTLVFAVGDDGSMLRYNGTAWSVVLPSDANRAFTAITMLSATLGYAVGLEGVHRWNGTAWIRDGAFPGTQLPRAVWASSPSNVIVAGSFGMIHRFDGATWTTPTRRTANARSVIAGAGNRAVVFGGATAVQLVDDESSLLYAYPEMQDVWAFDADHALAVGQDGAVFRYRSGTWTRESIGSFADLRGVWAAGPNAVFAVGLDPLTQQPIALRYDGTAWSALPAPVGTFPRAIWGTSATNVYVVGASPNLLRFDGSTWTTAATIAPLGANAIWGSGPSDILLVGSSGYAARFDGVSAVTPIASGTTRALVSVWGSGPNNYFVGTNGQEFHRFNGTSFTPVTLPGGLSAVFALWGTGPNEAFAVDFGGNVARFDGAQWQLLRTSSGRGFVNALHGTMARLFAVGPNGAVMVTR